MNASTDDLYRLALKHCYYSPGDVVGLHTAVREAGRYGRWRQEENLHFFEALNYGASLVWDEETGMLRVIVLGDHVRNLDADDVVVERKGCESGQLTDEVSPLEMQYDWMQYRIIRICSNWFGYDLRSEGEPGEIVERLSCLTKLFRKYGSYSVVHHFDRNHTYHGFQILPEGETPIGEAGWYVFDHQIDVTVPLRISLDQYFDSDWEPRSERNMTCALESLERECGKLGIDLRCADSRRTYFRDGPRIIGLEPVERCETHIEDQNSLQA